MHVVPAVVLRWYAAAQVSYGDCCHTTLALITDDSAAVLGWLFSRNDVPTAAATAATTPGTCEQLQCFRQDLPVSNSRGELRPITAGGATRALFTKLPGVGPIMAEKWFKAGFRSIESLLQAATAAEQAAAAVGSQIAYTAAGGSSSSRYGQDSIFPLGRAAMYSLQYSTDLLETMDPNDVTEMQQEVLQTLIAVTPGVTDGWVMQQVGGAIRGGAVHDADWLITNNKCDPQLLDGLVTRVYNHMVGCGRLVPQEEGFCRIQVGKLEGYKEKARKDLLEKTDRLVWLAVCSGLQLVQGASQDSERYNSCLSSAQLCIYIVSCNMLNGL